MSSLTCEPTLAETFRTDAIAFLNSLRSPDRRVQQTDWTEDIVASLTDDERRRVYEAYAAGSLSEGAAHVLLGDALYAVESLLEEMQQQIEQHGYTAGSQALSSTVHN